MGTEAIVKGFSTAKEFQIIFSKRQYDGFEVLANNFIKDI